MKESRVPCSLKIKGIWETSWTSQISINTHKLKWVLFSFSFMGLDFCACSPLFPSFALPFFSAFFNMHIIWIWHISLIFFHVDFQSAVNRITYCCFSCLLIYRESHKKYKNVFWQCLMSEVITGYSLHRYKHFLCSYFMNNPLFFDQNKVLYILM